MSIRTQKFLRFIPIVNFVTVFFWLHAYMVNDTNKVNFLKTGLKMVLSYFIVNTPHMVLSVLYGNPWWVNAVNWIGIWGSTFLVSYFAVKDQERIKDEKN